MHLKFNISDTHIWWKGSSRLNSNSTFQNYFPLGSPYFITCFPSWIPVFYHMISLLNPRIFTTWFHSWDSCILTTRFPSWIPVFYHMISLLDPRILSHDFPLGSSYFYHMISLLGLLYSNHAIFLLDTRIFTTWFPSWILLFFSHDFLLESL